MYAVHTRPYLVIATEAVVPWHPFSPFPGCGAGTGSEGAGAPLRPCASSSSLENVGPWGRIPGPRFGFPQIPDGNVCYVSWCRNKQPPGDDELLKEKGPYSLPQSPAGNGGPLWVYDQVECWGAAKHGHGTR